MIVWAHRGDMAREMARMELGNRLANEGEKWLG